MLKEESLVSMPIKYFLQPQRTAKRLFIAPTQAIDPVIVCVVHSAVNRNGKCLPRWIYFLKISLAIKISYPTG